MGAGSVASLATLTRALAVVLLLVHVPTVIGTPSPEATARAALLRPGWEANGRGSLWVKVEPVVESVRGSRRWGRVLDAGSGASSLGWLASLPCESVAAVTASARTLLEMKAVLNGKRQHTPHITLIRTNWLKTDSAGLPVAPTRSELQGPFDTIVMDYMFGALEHFSPFGERALLDLLLARLAPGGVFVVVGKQPLPFPDAAGSLGRKRWAALARPLQIMLEAERSRDVAMLLAQQRPYREFPRAVIEETLTSAGLEVVRAFERPIVTRSSTVEGQLDWAAQAAADGTEKQLQAPLLDRIEQLRANARDDPDLRRGFTYGFDYVLVCRMAAQADAPRSASVPGPASDNAGHDHAPDDL